jgi:hypothetical protein
MCRGRPKGVSRMKCSEKFSLPQIWEQTWGGQEETSHMLLRKRNQFQLYHKTSRIGAIEQKIMIRVKRYL